MDLDRARYLTSPAGRQALASLDPKLAGLTPTALATALRRTFAPLEASSLAEQLTLRRHAAGRLEAPADWLLTQTGLEMMTHPAIALRRAQRLASQSGKIIDLTCGLGGDLHPAAHLASAIGIERDPVTALLAAANTPAASVIQADATCLPLVTTDAAVIIDPSRRTSRDERTFDPANFSPPLDTAIAIARDARIGVIKGPPGLPHTFIPPDAEFEAVQYGRTLRESALWFGRGVSTGLRRAIYLPTGASLDSTAPECDYASVPVTTYLIDPQSCVTRAGLVRHLGAAIDARMVDPNIAYLTSDAPIASPLAEPFLVLDRIPFSVDRLRKRLREGRWVPHEIRRRAFPVEPDVLRKLLGRIEGDPVILICTTIANDRVVFICRPPNSHAATPAAN